MSQANGTNFFQEGSPVVNTALLGPDGTNAFISVGASASAVSGYYAGALLVGTPELKLYINTGTATTATWTVVGSQS